ncbi:MAG: helix-turn-helix transcriptional regulator [Chloroflexi bacterium]|nr:helix-turn-helix transcriptional regulator [Chloroflexota bacterium]
MLGLKKRPGKLTFPVDVALSRSLQTLAQQEQRPEEEVAAELLSYALAQRDAAGVYLPRWRTLSFREQQVAALICLGYTNREVAARLVLSPETVKTHAQNALRKFGLHSRAALRKALSDWDFSAWDV